MKRAVAALDPQPRPARSAVPAHRSAARRPPHRGPRAPGRRCRPGPRQRTVVGPLGRSTVPQRTASATSAATGAAVLRSTSTKSTRICSRPASAVITVRSAVAVRPERPITLPMSSGWTRTSSSRPRRRSLSRTGPRRGGDDAADQMLQSLREHDQASARRGRLSGIGRRTTRRHPCSPPSWRPLLGDGPALRLVAGLGQRRVEGVELVLLLLLRLDAGRRRVAGELLPVTAPLEDGDDGLGRLGADGQPVLGALELTSISDGSFLGWYLPISSIARPSRWVRESATTMR